VPAGWPDDSIAVPSTPEELQPLGEKLTAYFLAHPADENAHPKVNVTKLRAESLTTVLAAARAAETKLDADILTATGTLKGAAKNFRKRLRGLVGELTQKLDDMSPHWVAMGFHRPGAPDSPDQVLDMILTALGGGKLRVQCDPAPRKDYFQIQVQIVGVDEDYRLAASPQESDKILEDFAAGTVVNVRMRAVNETGQGKWGTSGQITVS
jgi:hypothetical protein